MKLFRRWRSLSEYVQHVATEQEWMPLREAAALYRVTPETMQEWIRQKRFSSKRLHMALWVSRIELEEGLKRAPKVIRS